MIKVEKKLEKIGFLNRTDNNELDSIYFEGKPLINFSSNDYLGLSKNKTLIASSKKWTELYGTSFSSSRMVSGNFEEIEKIENLLSKFTLSEKTLILNSGYLTNATIIPAISQNNLGQRNKVFFFSDKFNHSSINFGCHLTRQKVFRYNHLDLNHLENLLKKSSKLVPKIIITETVFSMDGDIVDIKSLRFLAKKYDALLYLDEAHSLGIFGKKGFGIASSDKYEKELVVGTFGKSFGSFGAFVSSEKNIYKKIVNSGNGLIYSTALTPGNYAAILEAIKIMPTLNKLRASLIKNATFLIEELNKLNFFTGKTKSHIIPIIIGNNEECLDLQTYLRNRGFFVKAIRSPTVPEGTERIRISLTATITKNILEKFLENLRSFKNR